MLPLRDADAITTGLLSPFTGVELSFANLACEPLTWINGPAATKAAPHHAVEGGHDVFLPIGPRAVLRADGGV